MIRNDHILESGLHTTEHFGACERAGERFDLELVPQAAPSAEDAEKNDIRFVTSLAWTF